MVMIDFCGSTVSITHQIRIVVYDDNGDDHYQIKDMHSDSPTVWYCLSDGVSPFICALYTDPIIMSVIMLIIGLIHTAVLNSGIVSLIHRGGLLMRSQFRIKP